MAKHKKKPDNEPELVEEPIDEEPALVEEEDEPALVEEQDEAALVVEEEETIVVEEEDEPALVEDEDEPALAEDEGEPALAEDEGEPALVDEEDEPAVADADDDKAAASLEADEDAAVAEVDAPEDADDLAAVKAGGDFKVDDDDDQLAVGKKDAEARRSRRRARFEAELEPGLTILNGALIVLNVLAALAFVYLLIMDYSARYKLQMGTALLAAAREGLPADEKEGGESAQRVTTPGVPLSPEELKQFSQKTKTPSKGAEFRPEKVGPGPYVAPSDRGPDFSKALFGNLGKPVTTLKEELKFLGGDLPEKIKAAAADAGKQEKEEANKQKLLFRLLMPLARTGDQVEALDRKIQSAKGDALNKLLKEAAERRLLADVLIPMEDFRFADWVSDDKKEEQKGEEKKGEAEVKFKWTERFGELDEKGQFVVSLEQMEKLLQERFTEALADQTWESSIQKALKRRSIEKRQYSAFFLLVIDRLVKPDELADPPAADKKKGDDKKAEGEDKGETPNFLYPDGLKRLQILVGQRDYTQACDTLAMLVSRDEPRIVTAIERDRGNYIFSSLVEGPPRNPQAPLEPVLRLRLRDPQKLADAVLKLLKSLEINVDENDLKKQVPEFLIEKCKDKALDEEEFKKFPSYLIHPDEFMKDFPDFLANKVNIVFADERQKTLFLRELFQLIDPREQGFVGRYRNVVRRLRDLAAVIEDRELRLKEVIAQEKAHAAHYSGRDTYSQELLKQLVKARARTLDLANILRTKQDQLHRAQLELAFLAQENQNMERQIRILERKYLSRGGK